MSISAQFSPELLSLVKALGLIGPDGRVNAGWFEHPLDYLRTILSNPHQRAALFGLIEVILPSVPGSGGRDGTRWHPLLEARDRGNVYLTIDGNTIGFAAAAETPPGFTPWARASLQLPLVDVSDGAIRVVAGAGQAPFQIALQARWTSQSHPSAIAVVASVDVQGQGSLRVILENLDPTAAPGTRSELDPSKLDADAARVLANLVAQVMASLNGSDPHLTRVATYLPKLLGFDEALPALPLHDLLRDPMALRSWLSQIAASPTFLETWFTALAGLLGSGLPAASPTISGGGTAANPLRAPLLELGSQSTLSLTLAADASVSGQPVLLVGLALELAAATGRLEGCATILALPLAGSAPVTILPYARLGLVIPQAGTIIDQAPAVKLGSVVGGVAWDGERIVPHLDIRDVVLNEVPHQQLDLTNANAVVSAGTTALQSAIEAALGPSRAAKGALALLGLRAPESDAGWPHLLDLTALTANPTRAIAEVHRAALADQVHSWRHLFGELAAVLSISAPVVGQGTEGDPWRVPIAEGGIATLELAAWNARHADTAPGTQLLRLGLRLGFGQAHWRGSWAAELLAFDLPQGEPARSRFLRGQRFSIALEAVEVPATPTGLGFKASRISADLDWPLGGTPGWQIRVEDLVATGSGDPVGPITIPFPMASFDPAATDLGLGVGAESTTALLRLLLTEALHSWGGPAAITVGAMLGLHRRLRGLPSDWPLLEPPDPANLSSLFEDPLSSIRRQLEQVVGGISIDGTPFILAALPWVRALLVNELPARPSDTYPPGLPLPGSGTYQRPWALPLADESLELVCWLDQDGPPRSWWEAVAERIHLANDSAAFVSLLDDAAALMPEVAGALDGRGHAETAAGLDALASWLTLGDGFVPAAAQVVVDANWREGAPVPAAHYDLPSDPAAIAQIRDAIDAWSGGDAQAAPRAVVLLTPPFADQRVWSAYLRAAEAGRPQDAHFDLRRPDSDPLTAPLEGVSAVATHYTADLADGDLALLVAQLGRVIGRVKALTGRAKVYIVGHSTAGLAARVYAAVDPGSVAGIVTLGTPHHGSALSPLLEPLMAGAVRLANVLYPQSDRTSSGRAIAQLAAALDAARPLAAAAFAGLDGMVDSVPGLAIPGRLVDGLLEDLVEAVADRARAASLALAPPTHFGFGVRARLNPPRGQSGEVDVGVTVRVDAKQVALAAGLPKTTRAAPAVHVRAEVTRAGGAWLVGGPEAKSGERLRRMELGVFLQSGTGGGMVATPALRLYDAGADVSRPWLELEDLLERLPSLPRLLPLTRARPATGTAAAFLLDALEAIGLLVVDGSGAMALSLDELGAIAAQPTARLGPRMPGLLDIVADMAGATRGAGPSWTLQLSAVPVELTLFASPWAIRLRTYDPVSQADKLELAPAVGVGVFSELSLPGLRAATTVRLELAAMQLKWDSAAGLLALAAPPWLQPIQLIPPPPPEVLRDALAANIPLIVTSSVISGVLGGMAGGDRRVRGIERLLTSPGDWLVSRDALGAADGSGLDPAKMQALLAAVGGALGLQSGGGISLPGGLTLTAAGSDPLTFSLSGTMALGAGTDELELQLSVQVDRAMVVSPSGAGILRLALANGAWNTIAIEVGADPAGVRLSVKPGNADRIELLPTFSGFGALAGGAVSLLPAVLEAAVDRLAPQPLSATGLLRAALEVAKALGIYDFDTAGFTEPTRARELGRMLSPGWLEGKATSAAVITDAIAAIFKDPDPLVDLPGSVVKSGSTVRWSTSLGATGSVGALIGWTGADTLPALILELLGVQMGPIVVDEVRLGFDQGLLCKIVLHLEPGGELAFLTPALSLEYAGGALSAEVYPLGASAKSDVLVRLTPNPGLELSPNGPIALLERWGLPLAAHLLLGEFKASLDEALWAGGPTARSVLERAGVVRKGSAPAALALPLPKTPELALRALGALATNATLWSNDTLALALRSDQGKYGIRLKGRQDLGGPLSVSVRFGEAAWLEDPDAGVTLWLLEDASGAIPVRITPALSLAGFGAILSGSGGDPLVEGAFKITAAGGFLFSDIGFLDANRAFALKVAGLGGAMELQKASINVSSDDGDSFLKKILPRELQAPFDLAVAWREGKGLTLYGGSPGGALELTFPLNIDLTILKLAELYIALRARSGAASVEAALTGGAAIGPMKAVVQRVGLKLSFGAAGSRLSFRAPDGLGLSIDAGPVAGGGFLFIDEPKGQYAGALQLKLQTLSLTAIGLLNTKMPDGSPIPGGFSLLLIIAVEFPPIQIGFGFTLNGIGGLLGLNRTMDVQALRAGVRMRALDAMLFPPDPIANAPMVVRTLSAVFPVAPGRFVIGPMVRLGWGTPPILTLDLAILLDLFTPIRVAVLGRIKLALPQDDAIAVVMIRLDVVGVIDFERGEVSIDAVLYDSLIGAFALTGEMALRARWKGKPSFVLAIGGFHPAFQPPANFPPLSRIAISLATGDNPRLRLESYLAVTSNTVQFGAALDLHAEAAGFAIDGHLGFDALIQLDPFGVLVEMGGSVSVRYGRKTICSVSVELTLTGPAPWHAWGSAKVSLLFLSATVSFDVRIGPAELPPPPPPVRVSDLLVAAVANSANWTAQPPASEGVLSLRSRPGGQSVAHPLGGLTFRQRVAPLELTIARYGAASLSGATRFEILGASCGSKPVEAKNLADVRDDFAAAQFLSLTDDEKLSRASFESFVSGVSLRFDAYEFDELAAGEAAALGYELIVVDEADDRTEFPPLLLDAKVAVSLAASAPAAFAAARQSGLQRFKAPAAAVSVTAPRFAVVPELDGLAAPVKTAQTFSEAAEAAGPPGGGRKFVVVRSPGEAR